MFLKLDNIYEIAFPLRFLCVSFVSSSFPFLDINRTGKWVISERLGENQGSGLDLSEIDLHFTTYNRKDKLHMASKADIGRFSWRGH